MVSFSSRCTMEYFFGVEISFVTVKYDLYVFVAAIAFWEYLFTSVPGKLISAA